MNINLPRRRLAALLAAVPLAALGVLLPSHGTAQRATAATSPIQHIVVLDLENPVL